MGKGVTDHRSIDVPWPLILASGLSSSEPEDMVAKACCGVGTGRYVRRCKGAKADQ